MKKLSSWYRKYRIVYDAHFGYEAQVRVVWSPFWRQVGGVYTCETIEEAYLLCLRDKDRVVMEL